MAITLIPKMFVMVQCFSNSVVSSWLPAKITIYFNIKIVILACNYFASQFFRGDVAFFLIHGCFPKSDIFKLF